MEENTVVVCPHCLTPQKRLVQQVSTESGYTTPTTKLHPVHDTSIDLESEEDEKRLREWCEYHWEHTFKKNFDNYNSIQWHECCVCFSKRGFSKRSGHPEYETFSLLRVQSFRQVITADGLYQWIRGRLEAHKKEGRTLIFPTINKNHPKSTDTLHHSTFSCSPVHHSPEQVQYLSKRVLELSSETITALAKIQRLEKDNNRLLASSQNWFMKYTEALKTWYSPPPLQLQDGQEEDILSNDLILI